MSYSADWLTVEEARERILGPLTALPAETLPLEACLGRVLAEPVLSPVDLPPWDNSGMDGYAVRAADLAEMPVDLRVIEDVPAGARPVHVVAAGTATRVMTGAPVPQGADSVVRVEHTTASGDVVRVLRRDDAGRNIRPRGEDVAAGTTVLCEGTVMRAAPLGVAASVGRSQLAVHRRPMVALVSSGDELVDVDGFGEVLAGRRIVSSNGYTLAARLRELGMGVRRPPLARDDPAELRARIVEARGCDALITSGGISVGAYDFTRPVLDELGLRPEFWRVRMKPGSPLAFGWVDELGGIPWFGLPGNPVSALITFEVFVRPALLRMAGHLQVEPRTASVTAGQDFAASPGVTFFQRVRIDEAGVATSTGLQGSGVLTSMAAADGLLVLRESVRKGESVPAILL